VVHLRWLCSLAGFGLSGLEVFGRVCGLIGFGFSRLGIFVRLNAGGVGVRLVVVW